MCEGGPVTKPLSNFEWEQILFLLGGTARSLVPLWIELFILSKRRSERYVRAITNAEK